MFCLFWVLIDEIFQRFLTVNMTILEIWFDIKVGVLQ